MILKQFGKSLRLIHDGKTYSFTGEAEKRDELKANVEKFLNAKSDKVKATLEKKILKVMEEKKEKVAKAIEVEETKLKGEKKLAKKKLKEDETKEVATTTELANIVSDVENHIREADKVKALEDENAALKAKLAEMEKATNKMPVPAASTSPVRRGGEY